MRSQIRKRQYSAIIRPSRVYHSADGYGWDTGKGHSRYWVSKGCRIRSFAYECHRGRCSEGAPIAPETRLRTPVFRRKAKPLSYGWWGRGQSPRKRWHFERRLPQNNAWKKCKPTRLCCSAGRIYLCAGLLFKQAGSDKTSF